MTGKTHAAVGVATSIPFLIFVPNYYVVFALIGALFPDIDADNSLIKSKKCRKYILISLLILFAAINSELDVLAFFIILILALILSKTEHRTIMHSLLGMGIFTILVAIINIKISLVFAIGYMTHLLTDSITVTGVPLLYPNKKMLGLKKFKTNGYFEFAIRTLSICIIVFAVIAVIV